MTALGSYEIPDIALSEAVALGQRIAREFAGEVSRHGLASAMGMAERGGAFASKLGGLRLWGVANGRSRIRVTRDGLRASSPLSPEEADRARRALAANVPLFVEISKRAGTRPYDQARLAVLIEEITGADRQEIGRRLALVDRLYSDVRAYLSPAEMAAAALHQPEASQSEGREPAPQTIAPSATASSIGSQHSVAHPPAGDRIEIHLPDGGLSLPESVSSLDAALTVLWARRQLLAARDAEKGRVAPAPPREFVGR